MIKKYKLLINFYIKMINTLFRTMYAFNANTAFEKVLIDIKGENGCYL